MNSDQIFDLIEEIANEPGKNAKIQMLTDAKCDLLEQVLKYTYDPLLNYGVRQIDYPDSYDGAVFWEPTSMIFALLNQLNARMLTGNAAREAITNTMKLLTENSAELLARIIRRDLRAGFSETTVNKVYKNLLPEFPYQRCALIKDAKGLFKNGPEISQVKADGMFTNINVYTNGDVVMFSRNGKQMPVEQYSEIRKDFVSKGFGRNFQFHGELLVKVDGKIAPREISNGILNSVNSGKGQFESNQEPVFMVWDMVPLEFIKSKGKYTEQKYAERFKTLTLFFGAAIGSIENSVNVIETKFVNNMEDAMQHYKECISRGEEGTVLKMHNAIWRDGTSKEQFKLKIEADMSLRIIEINYGAEHTKNEGRLSKFLCASEDRLLEVSVNFKGDDMQNQVEANPNDWLNKIIEVRANDVMEPTGKKTTYSLFLPRLVEANYRTDKTEADTLQKIKDQFESLVKV